MGFPSGSAGKESACSVGGLVWSLGWEDPLEKGIATHTSILAWRIPLGHKELDFTEQPSLSLKTSNKEARGEKKKNKSC